MPNVGTNWGGSYSRFTFDESKQYFMMLKEQGVPVLDDEFNVAQDMILTMVRRFVQDTFGDGSPNNGFKIVGTGATNNFTITGGNGTLDGAGHLYVAGWMLLLQSDVAYLSQPVAPAALTTPVGARTDEVYVDIYVDEVGPLGDTVIRDPTLNIETSRRLKLLWQVKVAEGAVTPANYTDANSRKHYTYKLATLTRTATAAINAGMVADMRKPFVDRRLSVFERIAGAFAPHEQSAPNMTVRLDAGYVFSVPTLTEVAAQSSATMVAPTTNPRIDRIVVDAVTGAVSVVTGVQGASPVAPAIPANKVPVAQVLLQTSSTVISNGMLTDERVPHATRQDFLGALVYKTSTQTLGTSAYFPLIFGGENYDTASIHFITTNPERLTVPSGVTKVRLVGQVRFNDVTGSGMRGARMEVNGAYSSGLPAIEVQSAVNIYTMINLQSAVLDVTSGSYFTLSAIQGTGGNLDILANDFTWFGMEIIE